MNPLAPVSDIMTTKVMTVAPNQSLLVVKEIFAAHNIHHIPVVEDEVIVGILSKSDFLRITPGLYIDATDDHDFYSRITVRSVMTPKVVTVKASERIDVAALILSENRFHAVPVIDEAGHVQGIVTSFDLLKYAYELIQKAWK